MPASYLRRVAGQAADLPRLQPVRTWTRSAEPAPGAARAVGAIDPPVDVRPAVEPVRSPTAPGLEPPPSPIARGGLSAGPTMHEAGPTIEIAGPTLVEPADAVTPDRPARAAATTSPAATRPAATRPATVSPDPLRGASSGRALPDEVMTRTVVPVPPSLVDPLPSPPMWRDDPAFPLVPPLTGPLPRDSAPDGATAIRSAAAVPTPAEHRRTRPNQTPSSTVVHIGTIEVVVDGPPVPQPPAPATPVMAAVDPAPASSLTRGYRSTFGLRQG